ncbi:hypothetical protein TNIN_204201 [Trichonephila inaurata madagascariensis]|uniref:Uncharacterized protein n=1 Tax=Trichonephila inaurata madagascariensis TaxID=2747483 RepID=A0A8X6YAF0_9ARAC|nr:hypothetical protein TNIN_204201 [Trichonephila inaurata madagascariensis]
MVIADYNVGVNPSCKVEPCCPSALANNFQQKINLESPLTESQLLQSADEVFYGVNFPNQIHNRSNSQRNEWRRRFGFYLKLSMESLSTARNIRFTSKHPVDKRTFSCGVLQIHYCLP